MSIDVTTATVVPTRAQAATDVGGRVRMLAVACVVVYWGLITAMMLAVPDAMHSPVLWTLLGMVTGGAILVFAIAPFAVRRTRSTA